MIQMFSVSKTYPSQITAFSDFYLEVGAGEFVFITGPSGSGRSSLLRILFGAEKPSSGEVIVNGIRLTQPGFKKAYQVRKMMGIISPDFKLLKDCNVRENISFVLEVMGYPPKAIKEKVYQALILMGLQEREKDSILSLSAGEQQRVAIGRALVKDPALILADEPTSILDDEMTGRVMTIFSELQQKGTTIVFATQDTHLIQRYPHRTISLVAKREGGAEGNGEVRSEG
ncbi:MAG: ATP-binding cassette domain-containing protein [Deltaproteobacteria bacterium]|nr:ATP-binding cassette domain-containing protein [Deltaproteobacteria bacterium]